MSKATVANYLKMRADKPISGLDDIINAIHIGTEWQAELKLSDLIALMTDHAELLAALKSLVVDIEEYERVNNLAPNPGRKYCWDSVAYAHTLIARAEAAHTTSQRGTE